MSATDENIRKITEQTSQSSLGKSPKFETSLKFTIKTNRTETKHKNLLIAEAEKNKKLMLAAERAKQDFNHVVG